MKEKYFTIKNIKHVSKKMLERVSSRKILELRKDINLLDSALLVIDMQRYFTSSCSHAFVQSSQAIIGNIKKLVGFFLSQKKPVIFTRHIDKKNKNNMLLKWWHDRIRKNDPLSEIDERVYDPLGLVVVKSQYDAFYKTELENILTRHKIKKLFITGVVANLCCETTARTAFVRGYEVYFGLDTTAAYCFEHHIASVINISYGFGVPFFLSDLVDED